jgi:hypothetical protein
MANLTLALDGALLKDARRLAASRDTTVNAMVRDYLRDLVVRSRYDADELVRELDAIYARTSVRKGGRRWTREELHGR